MDDTDRFSDAYGKASRTAAEAAVRRSVTETPPSRKKDIGRLLQELWEIVEAEDAEVTGLRAKVESAGDEARRADRLEEQLRLVQDELDFVRQSRDDTMDDLGRARETIRELQESLLLAQQASTPSRLRSGEPVASPPGTGVFESWPAGALHASAPPPESTSLEARLEPTPDASPADRLARAFAQWCTRSGAINGRADLFQAALRESLPEADVRPVSRDADSHARPVVLRPGATGNSAVPYWLVAYDGQFALLPQPMGPQQFRELAPCFDGLAAPATLTAIEPATVRPSGDGFELVTPGHVL